MGRRTGQCNEIEKHSSKNLEDFILCPVLTSNSVLRLCSLSSSSSSSSLKLQVLEYLLIPSFKEDYLKILIVLGLSLLYKEEI